MTDQSGGSMTPSSLAGSDRSQRLRRLWWRWSEQWPVSHAVTFVKGLPLLALFLGLSIPALLLVNAPGKSAGPPAVSHLQVPYTPSPLSSPAPSSTPTLVVPLPPVENLPGWLQWLRDLWNWLVSRLGVVGAVLVIPLVAVLTVIMLALVKEGPKDVYQGMKQAIASGIQWLRRRIRPYPEVREYPDVQEEINDLRVMLNKGLLEAGVGYYLELLKRTDTPWNESPVRDYLQETWQQAAPRKLRHLVDLIHASGNIGRLLRTAEEIGYPETVAVLKWGINTLDEDWQPTLRDVVLVLSKLPEFASLSDVAEEIQEQPWRAILRPWPRLSLWRDVPSFFDPDIEDGLRFLGLSVNPFGAAQAEADTLLLQCATYPSWFGDLRAARPAVITGATGSGKTAGALLLIYHSLYHHDLFPVYYSIELAATTVRGQLDSIALALSKTLLNYLAITPREFVSPRGDGQAAIVELFGRYTPTGGNLRLALQQAGLPRNREGLKMLELIEQMIRGVSFTTFLSDDDLLVRISQAYPQDFQRVLILADVLTQSVEDGAVDIAEYLQTLLDLVNRLTRVGVVVKVFLPDVFQDPLHELSARLPTRPVVLGWSNGELFQLLENRLVQSGDDSLAAWCDPGARSLQPDQRLVNAAQGMPGHLVTIGNQLLRRIGQTQRLLTPTDLERVLKPLSESEVVVDLLPSRPLSEHGRELAETPERGESVQVVVQIFLSYAREDLEKVENLYQELFDAGFKPWMDKKDILPGEQWEVSVQKAIRRADFFLACLTANSVSKRGFLQKEIKNALDIWREKLEDDIYLIPVRLEDCEVPESLRDFQWVDLFEKDGWTRLVKAIRVGMERRQN